jgi:hypothetical protein
MAANLVPPAFNVSEALSGFALQVADKIKFTA